MTTLTAVQGDTSSVEPLDIMTRAMDSTGKVNTVVCKLVKNWRLLYSTESNIHLFSNLLSKNICTRDIHSFLFKQAKLRKVHKDMDKPMSRAAMRAKLNDACAFANRQRRVVNQIKRELLKAAGNKKSVQREILKQVRAKLTKEKAEQSKIDERRFFIS